MRLIESDQADKGVQIWQEVEKQLAELENLTGSTPEVKLLWFQLAMQRKEFTNAKQLLRNLKADNHSRAKVAIAEIDLLTAQGRVDEAISKLYVLTERLPKAVLPVKYLAALLARHNSRENCQKVLKDAMQRIEDPIAKRELGILLVDFYAQWGQNDKSYQLLTELSQKLPHDIPIKRQLLKCQQVTKGLNQAQQLVDDIKAIEGEDGWQWRCEQANIWFAGKNFKDHYPQIIALLKENLTANPYDQTSRMLLAAAYEKGGELQLAVTTYRDALNRSPEDIRIIAPTITALYKAKEYEQADEILNRAAKQKLAHPQIAKLQLQSYLRQGKLSSAESILEDLLAKDIDNQTILFSLALLKMRQSKYDQARELLNKLKAQQPKSLLVTAALVELNVRQKNSDQALTLCNETIKQFGNASAYILRGKTYAMLGQNNLAKEDFERATSIEPDNIQVWILKSDFNQSIGQPDEAFKDIQKALLLDPGNILVQKRAIAFLLSSNEPDKIHQGRELLDKALSLNPQDVELHLYKARSLLDKGTAPAIEKAAQILQKITEDQPNNTDAWVLLGELALKQGQIGRAIDIALRGLVYKLNDKALLQLKARTEAVRSPALAISTLKLLYELDPNDVDTAVLLASTYIAADEPEKAVNLLRKQLSTCDVTTRRKCNIALAVALYKNGNKEDAEKGFESLSQSAPEDPAPLLAQAELFKNDKLFSQLSQKVIHWCQNHPEDNHTPVAIAGDLAATQDSEAKKTAENLLHTILDRDPNCLPAMNTLAVLLQTTGRAAASTRLYNQILELEPNNAIATNNLAWIMCEEQQKYEQAVELAQRGLEKAPDYIDLIDTRGVAYYRLGEFNKAVQDFNRCIKLYPTRTPSAVASYFHLGRALASLGKKDEAIENLKKTLELNVKIRGLSSADVAETQHLLQELSRRD
jgi:tetratricopeptide (TPR) repeat protein